MVYPPRRAGKNNTKFGGFWDYSGVSRGNFYTSLKDLELRLIADNTGKVHNSYFKF
jgi:hypothetical protein